MECKKKVTKNKGQKCLRDTTGKWKRTKFTFVTNGGNDIPLKFDLNPWSS